MVGEPFRDRLLLDSMGKFFGNGDESGRVPETASKMPKLRDKVHKGNARSSNEEREDFFIGMFEDIYIDRDHDDHGDKLK